VRRDFLEELRCLPRLDERLNEAQRYNLPGMEPEALEAAIGGPAERLGYAFEPADLPRRIATEAAREPVALPLLATLMEALWERRDRGRRLLLGSLHDELGGVGGALAARADELMARLRGRRIGRGTWEDRAWDLLLALVRPGRGAKDTRKELARAQAIAEAGGGAVGEDVLLALSGGRPRSWEGDWAGAPRLVVVSEAAGDSEDSRVELAHDSLLERWTLFGERVEAERDRLIRRDALEETAHLWKQNGARLFAVDTGPLFDLYAEARSESPEAQEYLRQGCVQRRWKRGAWLGLGLAVVLLVAGEFRSRNRELRERDLDLEIATFVRTWEDTDRLLKSTIARALTTLDTERYAEALPSMPASAERYEERVAELSSPTGSDREPLSAEDRWRLDGAQRAVALLGRKDVLEPRVHEIARDYLARIAPEIAANRERLEEGWREFRETVREGRTAYADLQIPPRYDLLPLRLREETGLWEFQLLGSGKDPAAVPEGEPWKVTGETAMLFVLLPGGRFMMGAQSEDPDALNHDAMAAPSEAPVREIGLSPFYMAAHECTVAQWLRMSGASDAQSTALPVVEVTWGSARASCLDHGADLPLEAQWEYACRAGSGSRYWFGDDTGLLGEAAWYREGGEWEYQAHSVGQLRPNPWGFHDMHGNVEEWCRDFYGDYAEEVGVDPVGPASGAIRVVRGGSFRGDSIDCRSSRRDGRFPSFMGDERGFRIVIPAASEVGD
jgi:formylglycine-generating enzyme required for sulfatase activity